MVGVLLNTIRRGPERNRTADTSILKKRFELSRFYVSGRFAVQLGTKRLSVLCTDTSHRQATSMLASVFSYHVAKLGQPFDQKTAELAQRTSRGPATRLDQKPPRQRVFFFFHARIFF